MMTSRFKPSPADEYIGQHHDKIVQQYKEKGFNFIYLPFHKKKNELFLRKSYNYLRYKYPVFYRLSDEVIEALLKEFYLNMPLREFYDNVINELELPHLRRPGLLRVYYKSQPGTPHAFAYFPIGKTKEAADVNRKLKYSDFGSSPCSKNGNKSAGLFDYRFSFIPKLSD